MREQFWLKVKKKKKNTASIKIIIFILAELYLFPFKSMKNKRRDEKETLCLQTRKVAGLCPAAWAAPRESLWGVGRRGAAGAALTSPPDCWHHELPTKAGMQTLGQPTTL